MKYLTLSSLRTRFVVLVLLAFIPLLAWDIYAALEQRRLAVQAVQEHAFRLLQPISAQYEQVISEADQLLSVLAETHSVTSRNSAVASTQFANLINRNAIYVDIGAVEPNGEVFANGRQRKAPTNVADQLWFKHALRTRGFLIGNYQINTLTRKAVIYVTFTHPNQSGEVGTVMYATIDLSWLNRLAVRMRLPGQYTLNVVDSNGTILARHPNPERWVGKSISKLKLGRAMLGQQIGLSEVHGIDGIVRTYAFTRLSDDLAGQYIYLAIGVPTQIIYGQANAVLKRDLILLAFVITMAAFIIWVGSNRLVLCKVDALAEAANRLAAGDLDARTGLVYTPDELGQLAECFDKMADSLKALTHLNKSILSSAGEGICGIDHNGNCVFINPAAAEMLGRSAEECIGQNFHYLSHHTKTDGTPYYWEECPAHATVRDGTMQRVSNAVFWRKDDTSFPIDYVAAPIRENEELAGAVIVFRDVTERKQMEEALRESEYFLRQVLDATPHITFVIDENLRILLANTALADFYDIPLTDIMGITQPELHQKLGMPAIELQDWIADNRRALEAGPIQLIEYSHNRAGVGIWYRTKKLPLILSDGTRAVLVVSEDISDLKETEERLRKTNRMLRVLSAINQILVRATDESELLQNTCETIIEVGGYRMVWIGFAEHDEEKTVHPVCSAGYVEGYLDAIKVTWSDTEFGWGPTGIAIRTGLPSFCSDLLTDPSCALWREEATERGYVSSIAVPLVADGTTIGVIDMYTDKPDRFEAEEVMLLEEMAADLSYGITALRMREERRLMVESLRQSEQRLRLTVEQTPLAVIEWGIDRKVTQWNPAAERIFGYSATEAKDQQPGFLVPPNIKANVEVVWANLMANKEGKLARNENITKDGRMILCDWYNTPLNMADGTVIGVVSLVEDVTEEVMIEQHKRDFYRRTILAATEGKLVICEQDEIDEIAGPQIWRFDVRRGEDLSLIRQKIFEIAQSVGMDDAIICDFILCVGEATTNAIKHAGGGTTSLYKLPDGLIFVVSDHGPGIVAINLPEVALKRGYTTAVSLGMGYKAMISIADQVYLATGPTGTTVAVEMKLHAAETLAVELSELPDSW